MASTQLKNQHLMWRAGFGPAAAQLTQLPSIAPEKLFTALQKASAKAPAYIDVADDYLKGLLMGIGEAANAQRRDLEPEERRMVQQKQREGIRSLNLYWMEEMVHSNAQLREKMAFFWHNHFACRNINVFYQQQLLHVLRTHALGSFRNLLHQVSKSAAMLQFLNAAQNRKGMPNENFAREVMELFTMGRGHYTENDIKEAARAFTGWSANVKGDFIFRPLVHDGGAKTVLGKKGNFSGEEVLDILLEQKQTSRFITQKIYRAFVSEKVDQEKVEWLAQRFYQSDYHIGGLLQDIFTADWFYADENIGTAIKSPVELMVGLQRMLPMQIQNAENLLLLQRLLGQVLFYPPNVAGWPGGRSWIDSTTLVTRMRLPQLLQNETLSIQPKTDDDQQMGKEEMNNGRVSGRLLQADINWKDFAKGFEDVSRAQLLQSISQTVLQKQPAAGLQLLNSHINGSNRESFIQSATLQLMRLPEYQLC